MIFTGLSNIRLLKMPDDNYSSIELSHIEITRAALTLIKDHLDGLPVGQARRGLRETELMIDATMFLDCSASEFKKACEGFQSSDV
ncbi:hypothetical protein [Erwinia tracheiphila]|nr:hypothetical protein [Erwinia tracheiphila]